MDRDYSSIYSIKEFYQNILPLYFDDSKLALATVGALGMFIDVNASVTEDMMNVTGRYITEIMPGQAKLPDFIYSQAGHYGISNILAKPAKMSMLLLVKEDDVINNASMKDNHLEFTLDADMGILVDDIDFSIPYDIKIRSTLYNGEYNHMAFYDQTYINEIADESVPFIKTMKTNINGDIWLVLRINVYQYKREKTQEPITTNSILNIPYIEMEFSDQLCNFEIFYTPSGSTTLTQLKKLPSGEHAITEPFIYYKFTDDNCLRLSFANDDRYWVPGYNSIITVYKYTCVGNAGNIPFNREGVDVYVKANTENESYAYNRSVFPMGLTQCGSNGGYDQLTLDKVSILTGEKQKTVNSYTTDNDLNEYFNSFASVYNHDAIFVKQRDDYAGREYGCFTRISGDTDIIPTNTLDIRLSIDDIDEYVPSLRQFIVKPGTKFVYETDDEVNVVVRNEDDNYEYTESGEEIPKFDIEYSLAPLMIITSKPNKVNFYINTIDKEIDVDYTYFNLDSVFNFVAKQCNVSRNALSGEDTYHIELQLARVDGVFNDLQASDFILQSSNGDIDVSKLEVLIVFDTTVGDYVRMTCDTTTSESGDYVYTFSADIGTTDMINDNRILITNLSKREDDEADERLVDMINPSLKFAVFYNYDDTNATHEYDDISIVSNHTLCNIYTPCDGEIYFAYPLNLVRSHVVFEDNAESNIGYDFYIKQVPLFGKDYLLNEVDMISIIDDIISEHKFLTDMISSLHALFTINMKFFNTYGRARNFLIGYGTGSEVIRHVNCGISLGIKFYDGIIVDDYIDLIKAYIKNYFESLNKLSDGTNQAYISVLDHQLHEAFSDQIRYSIFYSINGYDPKYQIIENGFDITKSTDINYIPEYLTLTTDDITITAL